VTANGAESVDHLGVRRLSLGESWFWYLVAGTSYVVASLFNKFLLNWIIGPVWLVLVIWVGPLVADRLRGRRG
jgi:hypothetical protein